MLELADSLVLGGRRQTAAFCQSGDGLLFSHVRVRIPRTKWN